MELAVLPFWGFCFGVVVGLMVGKVFPPKVKKCHRCDLPDGVHDELCPLHEDYDKPYRSR